MRSFATGLLVTSVQARTLRLVSAAVALLVLTVVLATAHPREIWHNLRGADAGLLVLAAVINLPVCALFTLRSWLVLKRMGHAMPLSVLLPASVLGNVAGALTPAASGELLRATALQRSGGLALPQALTMVAYERLVSTYLLVLSTVACIALTSLAMPPALAVVAVCAVLALLPWLAATLMVPRLPDAGSVRGEGLIARTMRYMLTMAVSVSALLKDLRLLLAWSVPTLASFGLVAFQFHLVARSTDAHLSVLDGWTTFGASGVAAIASLLPFGLGIGDGSMAAILTRTGIELERSAAIVVLIRAAVTLPLVLLATLSYAYLSRKTFEAPFEATST